LLPRRCSAPASQTTRSATGGCAIMASPFPPSKQFSPSERIPTNPGHQRNPGANSKLSDEMFFRIRLIKVSAQLEAGAKATQTGQRSQRQFRPTFDLLCVIQHQGETNYGGRELRCSGDGFGRDDRQSRRFHGRGGFDHDAIIGLIKFWNRCQSLLQLSVKTLMRNRDAPGEP